MKEIFKEIKDYEGLYQISNFGNVKSLYKNKLLKCRLQKCKYLSVRLFKNNKGKEKLVHRLVAETFIPNPENKSDVNHKDCNKLNNNVNNLEWLSHKDNLKHASINGKLNICGINKVMLTIKRLINKGYSIEYIKHNYPNKNITVNLDEAISRVLVDKL